MLISASRLRTHGHIGLGDTRTGLHSDNIGRRNDRIVVFGRFRRIAAAERQHRAILHGDSRRAAITRLAHTQINLIALVGCRDCNAHVARFGQSQSVFQSILIKGGRQRATTCC